MSNLIKFPEIPKYLECECGEQHCWRISGDLTKIECMECGEEYIIDETYEIDPDCTA